MSMATRRPSIFRPTTRAHAAGFTLVEILVAVVLTTLVLGSVALSFAATSRNRGELERSARMIENAQYALQFLGDEVRHAGYFAELNLSGVGWQSPDPCATTAGALGYAVAPFTAPVPVMGYRPGDPMPACLPHQRAGTAVLVLHRLSVETTPVANASGAAFVQVSKCTADPKPWVISDLPGDFTLRNLDCATPADVRRVTVRTYYVADCDDCAVDAIPTLKRAELDGTAISVTPLVEGVENLQVEYGFDGDGDGNADRWLAEPDAAIAPAYGEWSNVMAVRLFALVRATDSSHEPLDAPRTFNLGPAGYVASPNDGYKRVQLASIVRLNNVAGPRETP
jgi:type IV pilus assembly protein PilW